MQRWFSVAVWADDVNVGCKWADRNESEDYHTSKEQALAVCRMIKRDGLGGDPNIKPLSVRVEKSCPCGNRPTCKGVDGRDNGCDECCGHAGAGEEACSQSVAV